jgi:signal peptidase I
MLTAETRPRPPWWKIVLVGRNPKVTAIRLVITVSLVWITARYVLLPTRVTGISMEPTYRDGQIGFVNRLASWMRPVQRGDVLAIRMAGEHAMLLKRVVGLPGERLQILRGKVLINDAPLDEPYVINRAPWNIPPIQLSEDEYYVIGDNRGMPQSLHEFGRASRSRVVGRFVR